MVDELRSFSDSVFRILAAGLTGTADDSGGRRGILDMNLKSAKDLLGSLAALAGKGKDEIAQIVCREIGNAMANVLKEPITQVLRGRKLQVTLELVETKESKGHGRKLHRQKRRERPKSAAERND